MIGLITDGDESDYRREIEDLTLWCDNNLSFNVNKTKEIIVDFRKSKGIHTPISIKGSSVDIVDNFKFLGLQPYTSQTHSHGHSTREHP